MLIDLSGYRTSVLHRWHQKYGPVLRVGPKELSFAGSETVKEIYGQQTNFLKAPVYEKMSLEPLGIFSMRSKTEHSKRRRLLSHPFAQSSILDAEVLIRAHVQRLVECVKEEIHHPVDIMELFRLVAFDIVGK